MATTESEPEATPTPPAKRTKRGVPEGLWKRCPGCQSTIFRKEAEKRLMQGTTLEGAKTTGAAAAPAAPGAAAAAPAGDDGSLPSGMVSIYPGPWKEGSNNVIASAFTKKAIQGCDQYRYRQRAGGGPGEFVVQCKPGNKVHYFVWPQTEAVKGPVRF